MNSRHKKKRRRHSIYPSIVGIQTAPVSFPIGAETYDEEDKVVEEVREMIRERQERQRRDQALRQKRLRHRKGHHP